MGADASKGYEVYDERSPQEKKEEKAPPHLLKSQMKLAALLEQKNLWAMKELALDIGQNDMHALVNSPYNDTTFCHLAVKTGSVNILAFLVNVCGANVCCTGTVFVKNERGGIVAVENATPLWLACQMGNVSLVKALVWLGAGKTSHVKTTVGSSAFQMACYAGSLDIVQFLLENTTPVVDYNCLLAALAWNDKNHFEVARYLIKEKWYSDVNEKDADGMTLLAWCARSGNVNGVRLLIKYDAKFTTDHKGATPLMIAAAHGHLTTVKALLEYGDKANAKDNDGHDAVYWASRNGHTDIAKLLLDARFRKHCGRSKGRPRPASIFMEIDD
ncbi:protein fem-1 homolog A-like [Lingula anatina]|uniref:Protein fem-1 homolog A-like n=1 Tax=Lingula anatina TaxID=7574 RepID=A0A1S3IB77_LINAN|nr:protein fem-1 homolog A-like [Lingula anatina]|eukprot:XP_013395106.1 protein fem-1 homolog A-like [Lingula anatina]